MNFVSDAIEEIEGLLEANRDFCNIKISRRLISDSECLHSPSVA